MSLLSSLSLAPAHPLPVSGLLSWILPVMEFHSVTCPCLSLSSIPEVPPDCGGVSATLLVTETVTVTLPLSSLGSWFWKWDLRSSQAPSMVLGEGWPSPVMGSSDNSKHKLTADCWREVQKQVLLLRTCCPGHLHLNPTQARGTEEGGTSHKNQSFH